MLARRTGKAHIKAHMQIRRKPTLSVGPLAVSPAPSFSALIPIQIFGHFCSKMPAATSAAAGDKTQPQNRSRRSRTYNGRQMI
jgi:hypothetical protein